MEQKREVVFENGNKMLKLEILEEQILYSTTCTPRIRRPYTIYLIVGFCFVLKQRYTCGPVHSSYYDIHVQNVPDSILDRA